MTASSRSLTKLLPVIFCFFVMGFVDLVSLLTNYVKQDFGLSNTWANLFPLLAFFWFAVISIASGILMGRVGRKNTVLLSAAVTTIGMLLPVIHYNFAVALSAVALLGIGNTILQVALNPLLMDVVSTDRVASSITLGQFVKAISSFLGPLIVGLASAMFGDWKLVFPIYAVLTLISLVWLLWVPIIEQRRTEQKNSSIKEVFSLLGDRKILIYFLVILLIVGYEVGLMTTMPKYLMERCGVSLDEGTMVNSLYFAARTLGTFVATILLTRMAIHRFFAGIMICAVAGYVILLLTGSLPVIYTGLAIVGFFAASVFSVVFSLALQHKPTYANEISALMITGVAGGALVPPIMGLIADHSNQWVSLLVPLACLVYILSISVMMVRKKA
ncbi:MAG: MFS transporter [Alistipes sp.]|nr:MFS transporter [Alistipes sp.]